MKSRGRGGSHDHVALRRVIVSCALTALAHTHAHPSLPSTHHPCRFELKVTPLAILSRDGYDYLGYYGRTTVVRFVVTGAAASYCFRGTFLAIDQWEGGGDYVMVQVDGQDALRLKRESRFGAQSCEDDTDNPYWRTFEKPTPAPLWSDIPDPRPANFRCFRDLEFTFRTTVAFVSNLNAVISGVGSESFLLDAIVVTEGACSER